MTQPFLPIAHTGGRTFRARLMICRALELLRNRAESMGCLWPNNRRKIMDNSNYIRLAVDELRPSVLVENTADGADDLSKAR